MADILRDEGLLEKIQVLVAPPQSSSCQKQRQKKTKVPSSSTLPGSMVGQGSIPNNPYCDACGDGGDLLCCDQCPSSFHFFCCDPPMDPKNIPSGEWVCRRCGAGEVGEEVPALFKSLLEQAYAANPLTFDIPTEMKSNDMLPGCSKKHAHRRLQEREGEPQIKYCFACNKTSRLGQLVSCDFCPLVFHLDCLDPPLTTPPTAAWMCPLHPHHRTPGFDHPRLTERLRALSECRTDIQQHSVKIGFISRLARIPHYKRLTRHHNRRATEVPPAVKALYASPLPDVLRSSPLSDSLLTAEELVEWWRWEEERERREFVAPPQPTLTQDQDEWTRRTVICHLEQKDPHNPAPCPHPDPPCQSLDVSEDPGSPTTVRNESETFPDFTVFLAAHKLLELSGKNSLPNGTVRPPSVHINSVSETGCRSMFKNLETPETDELKDGSLTEVLSSCEEVSEEGSHVHNQVAPFPQEEESREMMNGEDSRHSPGLSRVNSLPNEEDKEWVGKEKVDDEEEKERVRKVENEVVGEEEEEGEERKGVGVEEEEEGKKGVKEERKGVGAEEEEEEGRKGVGAEEEEEEGRKGVGAEEKEEEGRKGVGAEEEEEEGRKERMKEEKKEVVEEEQKKEEEKEEEDEGVKEGGKEGVAEKKEEERMIEEEEEGIGVEEEGGKEVMRGEEEEEKEDEEKEPLGKEEEETEEEMDSTLPLEGDEDYSSMDTSEPAFRPGFVPDISQLDERLVRLLAMQRVQQLFTTGERSQERENSPLSSRASTGLSNHTEAPPKHLNGLKPVLLPKPVKPFFSPDILASASAILCPISGVGSAYPFQKMVTSIGTSSEMDVCLLHYGHCNFTSSQHACVFYDKASGDYELINYSEHGLIVDSVLYSCDFSDKRTQEGSPTDPTPLTLDDLTARGSGLRAERAWARVQAARRSLEDRERAKHALESALKLAAPLSSQNDSADISLSRSTNNSASASTPIALGLKRTFDSSSVVSIPLSKTKKHCLEETQKNTKKNSSVSVDTKPPNLKGSIQLDSQQTKGLPHPSSSVLKGKDSSRQGLSNDELFTKSCLCKRSASSLVGSSGKGWEGTATLYHGSRLRFGCIQFVLSIAGRPGHNELVQALVNMNKTSSPD